MKYTNYAVADFLKDEYFVRWVKAPDKASDFFWESWLANHPERRGIVLQARELILLMQFADAPQTLYASAEEEERILRQIIRGETSGRQVLLPEEKPRVNYWFISPAWRVAAVLVLAVSLAWVTQLLWESPAKQVPTVDIVWVEKRVPNGQKLSISLPDGTRVKLNAGSTLRMPERFEAHKRQVVFSGEAFFEVAKDTLRPFEIQLADGNTVRVTGTAFNLRTYENEAFTKLALVEGGVTFHTANGQSVPVRPTEMLIAGKTDGILTKHSFHPETELGWKDGLLIFHKKPFAEVFADLEKWYGVSIQCNQVPEGLFTGRFRQESLKNVLEVMAGTSGFSFRIEGQQVFVQSAN